MRCCCGGGGASACLLQVELLQRDVSLYKARIEELEKDFMKVGGGGAAAVPTLHPSCFLGFA